MDTFGSICLGLMIIGLFAMGGHRLVSMGSRQTEQTFTAYCMKSDLKDQSKCDDLTLKIFDREAWVTRHAYKQGLYD